MIPVCPIRGQDAPIEHRPTRGSRGSQICGFVQHSVLFLSEQPRRQPLSPGPSPTAPRFGAPPRPGTRPPDLVILRRGPGNRRVDPARCHAGAPSSLLSPSRGTPILPENHNSSALRARGRPPRPPTPPPPPPAGGRGGRGRGRQGRKKTRGGGGGGGGSSPP